MMIPSHFNVMSMVMTPVTNYCKCHFERLMTLVLKYKNVFCDRWFIAGISKFETDTCKFIFAKSNEKTVN